MLFNPFKRYIHILFRTATIILVGCLTSCQSLIQDVDPSRLPQTEPLPVVHCYISPQDTVLSVAVSMSRTSVGIQTSTNQFNVVTNAVVTLSSGDRSVSLSYNPVNSVYRAYSTLLPILAGQSYKLTVTLADGRQAIATATVPGNIPLTNVKLDSTASRFRGVGTMDTYIQLTWQDPGQTTNYYCVAGDMDYKSIERRYTGPGIYVEIPFQAVNPLSFTYDQNSSPYLTDKQYGGQMMTSGRGYLLFTSYTNGKPTATLPININAYLLNLTEEYYRYHESVQRQQQNGDNPFAEPTLIEGNIQGGFGCFGAYNRSTTSIQLK